MIFRGEGVWRRPRGPRRTADFGCGSSGAGCRLPGVEAERRKGRQGGKQAVRQAGRHVGRQTCRQASSQAGRHAGRHAGKHGRQAGRNPELILADSCKQINGCSPGVQSAILPKPKKKFHRGTISNPPQAQKKMKPLTPPNSGVMVGLGGVGGLKPKITKI